jgi:hypothetical protein
MEEEVLEKALAELKEYAERHGMLMTTEGASIKVAKDITEEVEECMFNTVWEEMREAEEICEKNCLISHREPTKWQRECVEVCLKCWEMTKRGECAKTTGDGQIEHLYAMESILKSRGLWYHSYWHIDIDEKVYFMIEFKPPPELRGKI